jgi:hypothetical protein
MPCFREKAEVDRTVTEKLVTKENVRQYQLELLEKQGAGTQLIAFYDNGYFIHVILSR